VGLSDRTRWAYRQLGISDAATASRLARCGQTPYALVDGLARRAGRRQQRLVHLPQPLARRRFPQYVMLLTDDDRETLVAIADSSAWRDLEPFTAVRFAMEGVTDLALAAAAHRHSHRQLLVLGPFTAPIAMMTLRVCVALCRHEHVDTLKSELVSAFPEPFRALSSSGEAALRVSADGLHIEAVDSATPQLALDAFMALGGEAELAKAAKYVRALIDNEWTARALFIHDPFATLQVVSTTSLNDAVTALRQLTEFEGLVGHLRIACASGEIAKGYAALLE
jgi:hypothetical protein